MLLIVSLTYILVLCALRTVNLFLHLEGVHKKEKLVACF